jgi:hypothetical protein
VTFASLARGLQAASNPLRMLFTCPPAYSITQSLVAYA